VAKPRVVQGGGAPRVKITVWGCWEGRGVGADEELLRYRGGGGQRWAAR
jgi:hypothetical protein